ncbi:hypothetical protein [Dyadobacter sp. Leaf189]|uniref:hypothetical protein n=1 Tax=Dyadobacter sp. Leaf189 TaxID=1736295 RepID=UPI0006F79EA7|nr:hypothetical protein [Dyadobacter sp. Leaf189]KQS33926.1 hypothetical protein ASG33_07785 [Dyadobacter sp. Leaf189]
MKKLLLLLCGGVFFLSCDSKEGRINPSTDAGQTSSVSDVELVDGVLKFSSRAHLSNVVKDIADQKDMTNWYTKPGFTSLLKRQSVITTAQYDKIAETGEFGELSDLLVFRGSGENQILEKIVDDPRLAAVLNDKGYIMISDTAYHLGIDKASAIKVGRDSGVLKEFLANHNMPGVKYTKIINEQLENARVQDYQNTDGNRRIIGEFKRHVAPFYSSLVVKVSYKKKNVIGWSGTAANHLSFTTSGTYEKNEAGFISRFPFSGSVSENNVEEISLFVSEVYGPAGLSWLVGTRANMYCQVTSSKLYNVNFYPE